MSEPKLYRVEVTKVLFVVATSKHEAEDCAEQNARNECSDPFVAADEVRRRDLLDRDEEQSRPWLAASVPDLDITVEDWCDRLGVPARKPWPKVQP